jgi:proline racemase
VRRHRPIMNAMKSAMFNPRGDVFMAVRLERPAVAPQIRAAVRSSGTNSACYMGPNGQWICQVAAR